MELEQVRSTVHNQFVQAQSDNADNGKKDELLPYLHFSVVMEYPRNTDEIIGDQAQKESDRGGPQIRHSYKMRQKEERAVVHNESRSSYKTVTEELYQPMVGWRHKERM